MDPAEFEAPEEAPQSPEQAPPSPDYVPGPEHPPSPDYVPGLEYLEYVAPADDEIQIENQPLLTDASPTALSPGYVADSDPLEEDPKEDPEEDPADYPADGRDDDDDDEESSKDDDNEEEDEASEEDEDEEEEHLAPADFAAATPPPPPPRSPQTRVSFSQTRLRRAQKTVRLQPPMAASTEALIVEFASASTPPSPPPSPLSLLSSPLPRISSPPLHTSPTYADAPLGYRAAMIQWRAASPLPVPSPPLHVPSSSLLLPSANRRSDIPETDMPFWKRLCLIAPASRFEVEESSTAAAARQACHTLARRVDYIFIDTMDASIRASESRATTAVEEVNERVTNLATAQRQDAHELHMSDEDAQDDRALLRAQISLLTRERWYFISMDSSYEREAVFARQAWSRSEDRSTALEATIRAQEARSTTLEAQVRTLQTQHDRMEWQRHDASDLVTTDFGRIHALEARDRARTRDAEHQDGPADVGSSW
ncbi:hypothetical protein Tco_1514491 [Tanacetum coccineum]